MAKVLSVNSSNLKGIPKDPVQQGSFEPKIGLLGDAHGGDWHRQVSLLAQESINKIMEMGIKDLAPGRFAENITTEGIELYSLPVGTKLKIGETLQEVTQIGKECHTRCAIFHTVGDCVMPKEGIFTVILQGGTIKAGDPIEIVE